MREEEFWNRLYMLLLLTATHYPELGAYDWIEPKKYLMGPNSMIVGEIGFIGGPISKCRFEFRLRRDLHSLEEVDWEDCLPSSEESAWLWLESGEIVMEAPLPKSS